MGGSKPSEFVAPRACTKDAAPTPISNPQQPSGFTRVATGYCTLRDHPYTLRDGEAMQRTLRSASILSLLSGGMTAASTAALCAPTANADNLIPTGKLMPAGLIPGPQPPGFISFCMRFMDQCAFSKDASAVVKLSSAEWLELREINEDVNRDIKPMDDERHYGRAEYWNIPTDGFGDCEDYALAKRQQLIAMGFSERALRIAIVYTWKNERHAVLTVVTDRGDFVLDNLTEEIRNWDETDYRWIEQQDPLLGLGWVSLESLKLPRALF
jgi:predicted transglutaminase-like cysteine proteinase